MAAPDSKALILAAAQTREVCDAYHEVAQATTYAEILQAGCSFYAWAYQSNVATDFVLADFPEGDLNSFGIYRANATITNPTPSQYLGCREPFLEIEEAPSFGQTLYTIGTGTFTLNQSGNNKCELYAMASTHVTCNLDDNAKLNLFVFNDAIVTVNVNDGSVLCFNNNDNGSLTITANSTGVVHGEGRGTSTTAYTGNDFTYGKFTTWTKSILTYTKAVSAAVETTRRNKSVVTDNTIFIP